MYGGRAIDSFDRRILTIYMDEYLGDFIFDTFQPFHFFHNKEVDYKIPGGAADPKERFVGASLWGGASQRCWLSWLFGLLSPARGQAVPRLVPALELAALALLLA